MLTTVKFLILYLSLGILILILRGLYFGSQVKATTMNDMLLGITFLIILFITLLPWFVKLPTTYKKEKE